MKDKIATWLDNIEKIDGDPPAEVIAFNFGIFEAESGYKMYLVGAFEYSEEDDDWACIEMPVQKHRYLDLPPEIQSQPWDYVLTYSARVLSELEKEGKLGHSMFKHAIAITTGFDDGELIKIR